MDKTRICPKCKVELIEVPEAEEHRAVPTYVNEKIFPINIKLTISKVYSCPQCKEIEVTGTKSQVYFPKVTKEE